MHLLEFNDGAIRKEIPANWNELSPDDLFGLFLYLQSCTPIHQVKIKMLVRAVGMQIIQDKKGRSKGVIAGLDGTIDLEQISQMAECFDFLFTEPDEAGNCVLDMNLTENPVKYLFKENDPGAALSGITYGQYQYLCHYLSILESAPKDALNGIAGTLFHPESVQTAGSPFDMETWLMQFPKLVRCDLPVCVGYYQTIILWYVTGSMRLLADQFPKVFGGSNGGNDEPGDAYRAQLKLLDTLTDGDVTKREAVRGANLWDVLHNLEMRIEKNEERKNNTL